MSEAQPLPFDAEAIAGTLAHVAAAEGDAAAVATLAFAEPRLEQTGRDSWDVDELTLYLEVPTELYARLFHRREEVQARLLDMR